MQRRTGGRSLRHHNEEDSIGGIRCITNPLEIETMDNIHCTASQWKTEENMKLAGLSQEGSTETSEKHEKGDSLDHSPSSIVVAAAVDEIFGTEGFDEHTLMSQDMECLVNDKSICSDGDELLGVERAVATTDDSDSERLVSNIIVDSIGNLGQRGEDLGQPERHVMDSMEDLGQQERHVMDSMRGLGQSVKHRECHNGIICDQVEREKELDSHPLSPQEIDMLSAESSISHLSENVNRLVDARLTTTDDNVYHNDRSTVMMYDEISRSCSHIELYRTMSQNSSDPKCPPIFPLPATKMVSIDGDIQYHVPSSYQFLQKIGSGAYGTVAAFTNKITGESLAVKKVTKAFNDLVDARRILREIRILRQLNHPNVIG